MPRIRTVKPEFWDSPDTIRASLRARLLYIAMWNWADDYGIGDGRLGRLINFAFPGDDIPASDFPTLVAEVTRNFAVEFYTHRGRPYYWIPNWEKHQRTEKKARQLVPYPCDAETGSDQGREPSDVSVGFSDAGRGSTVPGTRGTRGTGELEEQGEQARAHAPAPTALIAIEPTPTFDDFWAVYPRKADKATARKAWTKATKTTPPADVIAGAARYAADPNRDPAYTKHPGPWLNAEAWNNDPLPTRTPNTTTETPTERITRMRNAALAGLTQGDPNGNTTGMHRPAHSALSA